MSDKDSADCCLQDKSCCCVGPTSNQNKSEIKEISNPLPLDYFFHSEERFVGSLNNKDSPATRISKGNSDSLAKFAQSKYKVENDNGPSINNLNNNRNKFTQKGENDNDTNDLLQTIRNDMVYQEIHDSDDPGVGLQNVKLDANVLIKERLGKKLNIKYLTGRIIVGWLSESYGAEYNLLMKSLYNTYGKCVKKFELTSVNSVEKLLDCSLSCQTLEDQRKCGSAENHTSVDFVLTSLPHLMPGLVEICRFLGTVLKWLRKSRRNVLLLVCSTARTEHLLAATIRCLLTINENSRRYFKKEYFFLLEHEVNALLYAEKTFTEKFITSSLNRYISHSCELLLKLSMLTNCTKLLHVIVIKINTAPKVVRRVGTTQCWECNSDNHGRCSLQNIHFSIYQNFKHVNTTYKINISSGVQTEKLIFILNPVLPLNGDILIFANATNSMGFQTIFFRLQFHMCWTSGNYVAFRKSEIDKSYSHCRLDDMYLVEMYFEQQPELVREHESRIRYGDYVVAQYQPNVTSSPHRVNDLFSQIQVLDHYLKAGHTLSYTAGPVDGNLYAAITKPQKPTTGKNSFKTGEDYRNTVGQMDNMWMQRNSPSIVNKFQKVEQEISNATSFLPTRHNNPIIKVGPPSARSRRMGHMLKSMQKQGQQQQQQHHQFHQDDRYNTDTKNYRLTPRIPRSNSANVADSSGRKKYIEFRDNIGPTSYFVDRYGTMEQTRNYVINNDDAVINREQWNELENPSPYDNINGIRRQILASRFGASRDDFCLQQGTYDDNNNNNNNNKYDLKSKKMEFDESLIKIYDNCHVEDHSIENDNVANTQHLWFMPSFTRQDVVIYLSNAPIGSFIIRQSISLSNSLTISVKCSTSILITDHPTDQLQNVKHYIIDFFTGEGYRIRGLLSNKCHSSLQSLIQYHVNNKEGLPVRLILPHMSEPPGHDLVPMKCAEVIDAPVDDITFSTSNMTSFFVTSTVFHLGAYITRYSTPFQSAVALSVDRMQQKLNQQLHRVPFFTNFPVSSDDFGQQHQQLLYRLPSWATKMTLSLNKDRIILTDLSKRFFFRKFIKLTDILCCTVDPQRRIWNLIPDDSLSQKSVSSLIFGIVSSFTPSTGSPEHDSQGDSQIYCQLFCCVDQNTDNLCSLISRTVKTATGASFSS